MKIDVGLTMKRMLSVAIVVVLLSALGGCAGNGSWGKDEAVAATVCVYHEDLTLKEIVDVFPNVIVGTCISKEIKVIDGISTAVMKYTVDEELKGSIEAEEIELHSYEEELFEVDEQVFLCIEPIRDYFMGSPLYLRGNPKAQRYIQIPKEVSSQADMREAIRKYSEVQLTGDATEDATDIQSDVGLLANASPETSAMTVYYYDGSQTTVKMSFDLEKNKAIIEEINALGINQISPEKISEMKPPVYGIEISDKSGMMIWLTYSDGKWLSKDGSMYAGEYDLATVFEGVPEDNMTCIPRGSGMLNAALLGKYDIGYYALGEEISDSTGEISMEVLSISDKLVKLQLKNESKEEYLYGLPFTLEKEIDGRWYQLPVALSNWGFTLAASVLEPGGCAETYADLTMYGDLEAGKYRIVKEELAAEFEIR